MNPISELTRKALIKTICDNQGIDDPTDIAASALNDGDCPGICTTCSEICDNIEPDQDKGWCDECKTNTVISLLILMEII